MHRRGGERVARLLAAWLAGSLLGALLTALAAVLITAMEGYGLPTTPGPWLKTLLTTLPYWLTAMALLGGFAVFVFERRDWRGRWSAAVCGGGLAGGLALLGALLTGSFAHGGWAGSVDFALALALSGGLVGLLAHRILIRPPPAAPEPEAVVN